MLDASVIMLQQYSAAAALSMTIPNASASTSSDIPQSGVSTSSQNTQVTSISSSSNTTTTTTTPTSITTTTATSSSPVTTPSSDSAPATEAGSDIEIIKKSHVSDSIPGPSSSDNLSTEEQMRLKRLQKFEQQHLSDQE